MKRLVSLLSITAAICFGSHAMAQTIYSNTSASLFYNPATVNATTGTPIIYLDDVNIPTALMGTTDSLDVTGITFAFGKYGRQIPLWVNFYYSQVNASATNLNRLCTYPPKPIDSLNAYGRGVFGNLFKTYGDSVHTLFRVKTVKDVLVRGYNTFFAGMSFSIASDSLVGGYTHGPLYTIGGTAQSSNTALTWYYDGKKGGKVNKVNGQPGAFYLVVWGKPTGSAMQPVPVMVSNQTQAIAANANAVKWSVYPNPVNSNSQLQLQLPAATKVQVEIYAANGNLVSRINKGILPAGNNHLALNMGNAASGVYLIKMMVGNTLYTKTIYK